MAGLKDLPLDNGQRISRVFESLGWIMHRGKNHFVLTHPNPAYAHLTISIPDHKEVDRKLLRTEIRKAQILIEIFIDAYKQLYG